MLSKIRVMHQFRFDQRQTPSSNSLEIVTDLKVRTWVRLFCMTEAKVKGHCSRREGSAIYLCTSFNKLSLCKTVREVFGV